MGWLQQAPLGGNVGSNMDGDLTMPYGGGALGHSSMCSMMLVQGSQPKTTGVSGGMEWCLLSSVGWKPYLATGCPTVGWLLCHTSVPPD